MPVSEKEVSGVNARTVAGHEWDVTAIDTSNDIATIDISRFNQDITQVLSAGDGVQIENRLSSPESTSVASVTDNGDGTADIGVDKDLTDATVGGYLAYRLQAPGETGAELSRTYGLLDALDKDAGFWGDQINGRGEWDLALDVLHTESGGAHQAPADDNVKLEIDVGGTTYKAKGVEDLTATFTSELGDRAGLEDPLWRYVRVVGQSMEITTSGAYFDPESDNGKFIKQVQQEAAAANTISFTLTFGSLEFTGKLRASDYALDAPADNSTATMDFTFTESGPVTFSGSVATGLDLLVSAFMNRDRVHALVEKTADDGTRVTGATRYSGQGPVEELTLEASAIGDSPLSQSYSIAGDGPLDRKVQA
jgi:hypothetical protein